MSLEAMRAALPGMDWEQHGESGRIVGVPRGVYRDDALFGIAIRHDMQVARIFGVMYPRSTFDEGLGGTLEEQVAEAVAMVERLVDEAIDEAKAWTDLAGEVNKVLEWRPLPAPEVRTVICEPCGLVAKVRPGSTWTHVCPHDGKTYRC